jgi:hypothetical protein
VSSGGFDCACKLIRGRRTAFVLALEPLHAARAPYPELQSTRWPTPTAVARSLSPGRASATSTFYHLWRMPTVDGVGRGTGPFARAWFRSDDIGPRRRPREPAPVWDEGGIAWRRCSCDICRRHSPAWPIRARIVSPDQLPGDGRGRSSIASAAGSADHGTGGGYRIVNPTGKARPSPDLRILPVGTVQGPDGGQAARTPFLTGCFAQANGWSKRTSVSRLGDQAARRCARPCAASKCRTADPHRAQPRTLGHRDQLGGSPADSTTGPAPCWKQRLTALFARRANTERTCSASAWPLTEFETRPSAPNNALRRLATTERFYRVTPRGCGKPGDWQSLSRASLARITFLACRARLSVRPGRLRSRSAVRRCARC